MYVRKGVRRYQPPVTTFDDKANSYLDATRFVTTPTAMSRYRSAAIAVNTTVTIGNKLTTTNYYNCKLVPSLHLFLRSTFIFSLSPDEVRRKAGSQEHLERQRRQRVRERHGLVLPSLLLPAELRHQPLRLGEDPLGSF